MIHPSQRADRPPKEPTMKISIAGKSFEAADRYQAGHTVNENEAAVLNQTLMENVGNNLREAVKTHTGDPAELQSKFAEYVEKYQFGVRTARGPSAPSDPVGAEAHRLAVAFIKEKIRTAGKQIKAYTAAQINLAATGVVEKDPSYRVQAEQNVAQAQARANAGSAELDELLASMPTETPPTPAEGTEGPVEPAPEAQPEPSQQEPANPAPRRRR